MKFEIKGVHYKKTFLLDEFDAISIINRSGKPCTDMKVTINDYYSAMAMDVDGAFFSKNPSTLAPDSEMSVMDSPRLNPNNELAFKDPSGRRLMGLSEVGKIRIDCQEGSSESSYP